MFKCERKNLNISKKLAVTADLWVKGCYRANCKQSNIIHRYLSNNARKKAEIRLRTDGFSVSSALTAHVEEKLNREITLAYKARVQY